MTLAETAVRGKLGWWIEGYSPFVIAKPNGATTRASYREYNAYHLCLSLEAENQKLKEALERTTARLHYVHALRCHKQPEDCTGCPEAEAILAARVLTPSPSPEETKR